MRRGSVSAEIAALIERLATENSGRATATPRSIPGLPGAGAARPALMGRGFCSPRPWARVQVPCS
jgi:hypothetical protein